MGTRLTVSDADAEACVRKFILLHTVRQTRNSAVADRPRDASCRSLFC